MYKYISKRVVYAIPILYQMEDAVIDELDGDMVPQRLESCKIDLDKTFNYAPLHDYKLGRCVQGVYLKDSFRDGEIWF